MLVSIIVPFYNVEAYFGRCLDSIVNQSYRELEIILVNDCSPDNSIAIARKYAAQDSRIKIIEHLVNKHQGGARNSAMAIAKGEYIWFIDSDDEIASPYAVEHLVSVAKRDNADIVMFNGQRTMADGKMLPMWNFYPYVEEKIFNQNNPFYSVFYDVIAHDIRTHSSLSTSACFSLYNRMFLLRYQFRFLENTFYEDVPAILLLPLAKRITQIPYIYYNYNQREGSTMRSATRIYHVEHFKCVATQLWYICDTYWPTFQHKEVIVPILLMYHPLYNVNRTLNQLTSEERGVELLQLYHFLEDQLASRITFDALNPWPKLIIHQAQWKALFTSFGQVSSDTKKVHLLEDIISPPVEPNRGHVTAKRSFKKMIKMLLPYGLVRVIQIQKNKKRK